MTLTYDEETNELVSVNGTQEFRLQMKGHERSELARIVDEHFRDEAESDEGGDEA